MTTVRIPIPFANTGTKTPIDVTRPDGVVNLTTGYGDDYSRELGVDPSAKAIERDNMNWLLNIITTNMIDWQMMSNPQWVAQSQYEIPAVVRYTSTAQPEKIYRCVARPPLGTIPTDSRYWEEVLTAAENLANVALPTRGPIGNGTDWNTLGGGIWTAGNFSDLTTAINGPNTTRIGYLITYRMGTPTAGQTYYDDEGRIFHRTQRGSVWQTWRQIAYSATTLAGYGITNGVRSSPVVTSTNSIDMNTMVGAGNLSTDATRWNATYGITAAPTNWAALNYPRQIGGTLLVYGIDTVVATAERRISQMYTTQDGEIYTRSGLTTGGATTITWTAWIRMLASAQQVIDELLPRTNTWTGGNIFTNSVNFDNNIRTVGLNLLARQNSSFGFTDVGLRIQNGATTETLFNWDVMMNRSGDRGFYNRGTSQWDLRFSSDNNNAFVYSSVLALNSIQRTGGSALQLRTSGGGAVNPSISSREDGQVDINTINASANGLMVYNFNRNGDLTVPGSLVSTGHIAAGPARFQTDGNVAGSVWGASGLLGYLNSQNRFVRVVGNNANIQLFWEGTRIGGQVAGTNFNYAFPFIDEAGNLSTPRDLVAGSYVYAGDAFLTNTGNIGGSTWGGDLYSYLIGRNNFIRNATGSSDIRLYWENNRMQFWVDGGYAGTPAMTGELNSYWLRNEFLRPDQGGWRGVGSSNGTWTVPAGGVWAYFIFGNDNASNLTRAASGVVAGGTAISLGDGRAGSALMWRIY